eukprot:72088_1
MLACTVCVDTKRKWKNMDKSELKHHYIAASKKELLHHNVTHLQPSQLLLGYHYYEINQEGEIIFPNQPSTKRVYNHRPMSRQKYMDKHYCPRCNKAKLRNNMLKLSNCDHNNYVNYCCKCIGVLVNTFMKTYNDIPRCSYPYCNKPFVGALSLKEAKQYRIKASFLTDKYEYNKHHTLFHGYMRMNIITRMDMTRIPSEIISLIFDFYKLYFWTKIDCSKCFGVGLLSTDCDYCIRGKIQRSCRKCKGNGQIVIKNRKKRTITKICKACNGSRIMKKVCTFCDQNNQIWKKCLTCDGDKYLLLLNFAKLRNKQLLCAQCNKYFVQNSVVYWSSLCKHVFCIRCFDAHIKEEAKMHVKPICALENCSKYYAAENLKLITDYGLKNRLCAIQTNTDKLHQMGYNLQTIRVGLMVTKGNLVKAITVISKNKLNKRTHSMLKKLEEQIRKKYKQ